MKFELSGIASSRSGRTTLFFLATGAVALVAALVAGIADNPTGLALVYAAITAFVLAVVHRWRSIVRFLLLLVFSLLSFPVAVVLHNLLYALGELASDLVGLAQVLGFLEVAFFLIAVLVCPPCALVGAAGATILGINLIVRARYKNP